jgi:hypothetical protein
VTAIAWIAVGVMAVATVSHAAAICRRRRDTAALHREIVRAAVDAARKERP